jgi:hypothetical protein
LKSQNRTLWRERGGREGERERGREGERERGREGEKEVRIDGENMSKSLWMLEALDAWREKPKKWLKRPGARVRC